MAHLIVAKLTACVLQTWTSLLSFIAVTWTPWYFVKSSWIKVFDAPEPKRTELATMWRDCKLAELQFVGLTVGLALNPLIHGLQSLRNLFFPAGRIDLCRSGWGLFMEQIPVGHMAYRSPLVVCTDHEPVSRGHSYSAGCRTASPRL